jgi:hypothetical protein
MTRNLTGKMFLKARRVYRGAKYTEFIPLKNVVQNDVPCLVHDAIAYAPYALH